MAEEEPYNTYPDYWPCKPAVPKICWIVPALVLVLILAICLSRYAILGGL